jgi:hypothetical protein
LSVDGKPGFNKEVFETIEKVHSSANTPIICNLVVDEISIRRGIRMRSGRTYGFVDLGFENVEGAAQDGCPATATKALVFMLVALNSNWKCPCGYALIDSLDSEKRAQLVKRCLALSHDHKINVHSLALDGDKVQFGTAKALGANMNMNSEAYKPFFQHPTTNEKVFVLPDGCHMLKNIRNALSFYEKLFDANGNTISWKYIERLQSIQESEGLHIANKLTKRHIKFKQNIMNVRIATQTLSNSVKDSLLNVRSSMEKSFSMLMPQQHSAT